MISFEEMVAGFVTEQPDSCHVYFQLILPAGTRLPEEPEFFADLSDDGGLLRPITKRLMNDHTLMLSIRKGYINVYYRGGNLLKISELSDGKYSLFFDTNYNKGDLSLPSLPKVLSTSDDVVEVVKNIPFIKEIMDDFFAKHPKTEREYQQLVSRENNYSTISTDTEYFISDIEFADTEIGAKFDLLAVRWLKKDRRSASNCIPALIEMKYGDKALEGSSGLIKHLKDIEMMVKDSQKYPLLLKTMEEQFNQLDKLQLLNYTRNTSGTTVRLSVDDKPEVILLLANHNPRVKTLSNIVNDEKLVQYGESEYFDLKFFVSSFAGYGLHSDCMLNLSQFRELLNR